MISPRAVLLTSSAFLAAMATAPAVAQEASDPNASSRGSASEPSQAEAADPITISGTAAVVSQYRFRGVSQSNEEVAAQAGITATHKSGLYAGVWGSNLAGFGTFGGANLELDVFGGYKRTIGGATVDAGLLWYLYPGTDGTDYAEPYASVSGTLGPASIKLGAAYAPKQRSIGSDDNLYLYGDAGTAIPGTPVTLKGHLGYTQGKGSTLAGPDGDYLDYALGADFTYKVLTFNVSYIDTDIGKVAADGFYTSGDKRGRKIVDGAVVVSLTAAF